MRRGIAFHNARAFVEAERCYQTVLQLNPKNPDALNLMGVLAVEANQRETALDYFQRAVKIEPEIAIYRNNLGNALCFNTDFEHALVHLQKAVALDPNYLEAICNLGKVNRLLGDITTSTKWLNRALRLQPGHLTAINELAEIESELGRFDQAIQMFEGVLARDPMNVEALCGLAQARKFESGDPWIMRFEELLRQKNLRADQLAPLHHAFAKICNDLGRYDDAFVNFTIGKTYKNIRFDAGHLEETYRTLASLFTPEFFLERQGWGSKDERPVFVVGLPRSGTTLTEQILSSHGMCAGLGELPDMRRVAQQVGFGKGSPATFANEVRRLKKTDVRRLANTYLNAYVRSSKPGAARMLDKSPHNYELLGLIALLFPKAHVLFCQRNPMDNCVAIYMQNFDDSHGYNRSLSDLGRYWRAYRFLREEMVRQVPLPIALVDYESTVADPEEAARRIVKSVGLPWDDACLRFYETERAVRTPSRWQVRQPIYTSSVGRWNRYASHLGPLQIELGKAGMGPAS